jgi:mRNA degradation ribonuclease J1/J2
MVDSTNAEIPGFVTAERDISPALERVFIQSRQRVIVACFASHVHRVQQILDAAVAHGRKVVYVGRSMVRNMGVARDLGYLNVPANTLIELRDIDNFPAPRGGADLHRLPGRAAVRAVPDGQSRASVVTLKPATPWCWPVP